MLTIVLAMLVLLCMTSCVDAFGHVSDEMALDVCTTYSIPGFERYDLKGPSSIEILETDDYGRYLYTCLEYNVITNTEERAVIICQKIDDDYVYFYEDKNYLAYKYTETDITELKIKNDWNLPVDVSKLSRCKIKVSFDLCNMKSGHNETRDFGEWLIEKTKIKSSDNMGAYFVLSDSAGNDLYIFSVNYKTHGQNYAVIVTPNKDVYLMPVDKNTSPQDYINFKLSHGWQYGY